MAIEYNKIKLGARQKEARRREARQKADARRRYVDPTTGRINYIWMVREVSSLMSLHCRHCRMERTPTKAFFGEKGNGGATIGSRPADRDFQKRIYKAAKKHIKEVHPECVGEWPNPFKLKAK